MKKTFKRCDVLVVGAGISGIAAALASARNGSDTFLVEKNHGVGGTAVFALHRYICGLYLNGNKLPQNTLNEGITREICARLKKYAPDNKPIQLGKVYVLPYSPKNLATIFKSLIRETKNLRVFLNTEVFFVEKKNKNVVLVKVRNNKETFNIIPKVVVDCSAEGVVVKSAQASYQISPLRKRPFSGYTFRINGLKNTNDMLAIKTMYYLRKAVIQKKFPYYFKFTTFIPSDKPGEILCRLNMPPTNIKRHTQIKKDTRRIMCYFSKVLPEFKNASISEFPALVFDREGLRPCGNYILTENDILKARKFPDAAAKSSWPIEFWDQKKGPQYRYLKPGDYYEIPLRCLKSKDVSNLYFAGCCISATAKAYASTRVMGTCISLGEQAGLAATKFIKIHEHR